MMRRFCAYMLPRSERSAVCQGVFDSDDAFLLPIRSPRRKRGRRRAEPLAKIPDDAPVPPFSPPKPPTAFSRAICASPANPDAELLVVATLD
jgi:hypothetical protein